MAVAFTHLHDHPLYGGWRRRHTGCFAGELAHLLALCAARLQLSEMVVATCTICLAAVVQRLACAGRSGGCSG